MMLHQPLAGQAPEIVDQNRVLAGVGVHDAGRRGYCCAMGNNDGELQGEAMGTGRGGRSGAREDAGPVQSVDRAVAILEILARDGEAGVTEVARELGVHKSTASRLLAALDRRELVAQDAARGRFRLGLGILLSLIHI